jgi:4-hydroxybenzoate polyprenyltransferase
VLSSLLLRVFDELKDVETDLRLGHAGDPKYVHRPIVTGHILEDDWRALRDAIVAALVLIHGFMGSWVVVGAFAVLGLFWWLSSRWFFIPAISKNLLLAFVTHNPLSLVLNAYVASIVVADCGPGVLTPAGVALVLGLAFPIAAWETSRKIRVPDDETDYQTYSKLLGPVAAALLPASFVLLSVIALAWAHQHTTLAASSLHVVVAAACLPLAAVLRFLLRPSRESAKLQFAVEAYTVVVTLGLPITLLVHYGLG